MACKVEVSRHGSLAYKLYWFRLPQGTSWEGTSLKDNPKNRRSMEARAVLMNEEFEAGTFDYLKWFPNGNKAHLFRPQSTTPKTIGEYYRAWILRKTPPIVRPGLQRDYRDQFRLYILPKFENTRISELTPAELEAFRRYLLQEYKARTPSGRLSLKSVKNIMDGSFRAMIRDARTVDYLIEKDPFEALLWPRKLPSKPDPFEEEERDAIIAYFRQKSFFLLFVRLHVIFHGYAAVRSPGVILERCRFEARRDFHFEKPLSRGGIGYQDRGQRARN